MVHVESDAARDCAHDFSCGGVQALWASGADEGLWCRNKAREEEEAGKRCDLSIGKDRRFAENSKADSEKWLIVKRQQDCGSIQTNNVKPQAVKSSIYPLQIHFNSWLSR